MEELEFYDGHYSGPEQDELFDKVANPDTTPTENSEALLESGGAYSTLALKADKTSVTAAEQISAPTLVSPATENIAAGKYRVYNNLLYQVTSAISSGETASSFESKLTAIPEGGLNDLKSALPKMLVSTNATTVSCQSGSVETLATLNISEPGDYIFYARVSCNKDLKNDYAYLRIIVDTVGTLTGTYHPMVAGSVGDGIWVGHISVAGIASVMIEQYTGQTVDFTCSSFNAVKL